MLFTVILNDTNQTPVVVVAAVVVDAAAVIGLCMLYVKSSSEKKTGSFTCKWRFDITRYIMKFRLIK